MKFTDQIGNTITLNDTPRNIVSVVPSQTELLFDLGLDSEVVGITKFCIHPELWFRKKERVGGTKKLNIEKIRSLKPDLIIANKEENTKEDIEVSNREFNVWVSDITNLQQAFSMIESVGQIVNKSTEASNLVNEIKNRFGLIEIKKHPVRKALYLIWKNPYMSIGGDTFISSMMELAGFQNVLKDKKRYPELSLEEINLLRPEVVLLSSEPFPFKDKDVDELQKVLPNTLVIKVDGELFSWYGSRLLHSPAYFSELSSAIHAKTT